MPSPPMINAFDPAGATGLPAATAALLARRSAVLGPSYRLFYETPIHVKRAAGARLYDADDTPYLDCYNNVPAVGHGHPAVVEAVSRQLQVLNTHTRYLTETVVDYAERLIATVPPEVDRLIFTCTGSEASDLALRIARAHTGGTGVIVTANAYHGVTAAVAEVSPSLGRGVPLGPHVRAVPAPGVGGEGDAVGAAFQAGVEAAIADLDRHGIALSAMIVDTIFSSDGIVADPPGFLTGAVAAVRAAGGLFIADEVQPGFARTGTAMWGFARHGLVPDLVVMGKPMGNGLPIGGVAARAEVLEVFARTARYFNTFGGNPVCCAAGLAVLDVIAREGLQENARSVGARLQAGVRRIAARWPAIGDVRGAGLFVGVDVVSGQTRAPDPTLAGTIVNRLRDKRVLISASGPLGHVLKIRPPLCFTASDADMFLDTLGAVLAELPA